MIDMIELEQPLVQLVSKESCHFGSHSKQHTQYFILNSQEGLLQHALHHEYLLESQKAKSGLMDRWLKESLCHN